MAISFKMVRNLGLSVMVMIIVLMGFVSLNSTRRILKSLSIVLEKERPKLEMADCVRECFLSAKDIFIAFYGQETEDINPAISLMDEAIKESLALKDLVAEEEKKQVESFITNAKRFKTAAFTYAEESLRDPSGVTALSMEKVAMSMAKEANISLNKMIKDIRSRIKDTEAGILGLTKATQRISTVILLIGIIAGLLVAFFMARALSTPLRKLATTATLVAKAADLTQLVEVKTKDEIGQLGLAYNKLIESLRNIIMQIRDAGLRLTTAANQILTASQQQATGIEEEATQISQTATSARQLVTTAKQVTDRGNEIEKSSANSLKMIKSRNETCAKCRDARGKIKESMLETAKKIEGLGERAQSITEIVRFIEDIADQTNLLSLNAAIEAARAGEAGKGFAVVADAIGKLAEKTTKSTKDISDLIKGVQQETSGAVLSAEKSTKAIEETTPIAEEAANAMLEVGKAFEQVAQTAKEIALSSQQQSSGSEQISKAMMGIDQIMKQSAASAKQSTASASDLAKLAEELKAAIGQFKLGEEEK